MIRRKERPAARRGDATGPRALFAAWLVHDIEEAVMFPRTSAQLAELTGIEALRMNHRQSVTAVGLMGGLVGFACLRGARTQGRSGLYRTVLAGLESHVVTHVMASVAMRGYTAGVATAVPVMLPGALVARHRLARQGIPLHTREAHNGAVAMLIAAFACQVAARALPLMHRGR